jgi:hypothetical protein
MRTTVTLDDDLVATLKWRALERGVPFKQVLNEAIRAGIADRGRSGRPYRMKPARALRLQPGIDMHKALQLAAELEDEEIMRKLEQGR